jgi:hypothetical protein
MQMQIVATLIQMHRKKQGHQSQIMISMKVTDEYVINLVKRNLVFRHLHLSSLTAIDEEMSVLNGKVL